MLGLKGARTCLLGHKTPTKNNQGKKGNKKTIVHWLWALHQWRLPEYTRGLILEDPGKMSALWTKRQDWDRVRGRTHWLWPAEKQNRPSSSHSYTVFTARCCLGRRQVGPVPMFDSLKFCVPNLNAKGLNLCSKAKLTVWGGKKA